MRKHLRARCARLFLLLSCVAVECAAIAVSAPHVRPDVADMTATLDLSTTTARSLNWSGYVAGNDGRSSPYTAVSGSWIVPAVDASGYLSADATWVGIGGVGNSRLIQAGTQAVALPDGNVEYQAWMEGLPGESVSVPLAVHSGDIMSVEVREAQPGSWCITIHNDTTGKDYATTVAYAPVHSSAEWIEEVPSGNEPIALDDFSSVHFLSASAVRAGATVSPAKAGAQALSLVSVLDAPLAVPSVLDEAGSAFRIARPASL